MDNKGLRLVSFDAGGIRSLSQLKIMETLIYRIQYDLYPNDPDKVVLPCECFDMMGGSDTGGIIAVMLSRLRISVEDATEEFFKICNEVYIDGLSAAERTERLRNAIQDLLRRKELPLDLKLGRDARIAEEGCPCFVIATPTAKMDIKIKLRSYRTRSGPASNVTVVEAILATCATQPSFLPISIGPLRSRQELIGGATGAGNPCHELVSEAYGLFGKDIHVSTILSIGSGRLGDLCVPLASRKEHWLDLLNDMVTNGEQVSREMEAQVGHLGLYYRFSVEQGLQRIHEIDVGDIGRIDVQAEDYLEEPQISRKLDHCVESLRLRQGQIPLEQLKHTTGGQPIYKDMPSLTSYFVMRQEPWDRMVQGLLDGDTEMREQRVMVISGMGGCGKTQLVVRFSKEYKDKFKHAFFVDGSTRESVQADIINHARTANTAYSQANFHEALNFFSNPSNCPWMLIYDNVDDVNLDLSSLIPDCHYGVVVITTRTQSRGQLASPPSLHLKLDVMSAEEAIDAILLSANMEHTEQTIGSAGTIAMELGNLPVALVQAGSYMQQSECSCEEYLERLHKHKETMMYKPAGDRLQRSAYAAFDLSYQRLQLHVQQFLHIIGYLHFANFPMETIKVSARTNFAFDQFKFVESDTSFKESVEVLQKVFCPKGTWDELELDGIITELKNYSLASFTRSTTSILLRIHPLMHQWTLVHLPADRKLLLRCAASRLLACCSTEETLYQYLLPHIDKLMSPNSQLTIHLSEKAAFGYILRKMRPDKSSRDIWEDIYTTLLKNHGNHDLRVATAAIELAATYEDNWERKETLEKEAVDVREKVMGPDAISTLEAKASLSGTYHRQGRWKEAEELLENTVEKMKKELGPTDSKVIKAIGWLARVYDSQGRYSDAEVLQTELLETQREKLGANHPDTTFVLYHLGWTYFSQGRYSEAERLQEEVLNARKERLGDAHPDSLLAMNNLAVTYNAQGRPSDAEPLLTQVLKIRKERQGNIHPDTLLAMHNLAGTYRLQDRYSDAQPLQEHVFKIRKERLGDAHPDTLWAMHDLAFTYHQQGRYSDARSLREHVLKIRKEHHGDSHPDTLSAMGNLAMTYYSQGQYSDSQLLEEKVLEERRRLHGDNHSKTARAMNNLGWTYYSLGHLNQAKQLAVEAEEVWKVTLGIDHPDYKAVTNLLQQLLNAMHT